MKEIWPPGIDTKKWQQRFPTKWSYLHKIMATAIRSIAQHRTLTPNASLQTMPTKNGKQRQEAKRSKHLLQIKELWQRNFPRKLRIITAREHVLVMNFHILSSNT